MYTRCPKCSTCFRVTERHLAIAKGKVRCGQCHLVFNAPENAIDDLPTNISSAATSTKPTPPITPTAKAEIKKPTNPAQKDKVVKPAAAIKPQEQSIKKPVVNTPTFKADTKPSPFATEDKVEKIVEPAEVIKPQEPVIEKPVVETPQFSANATMIAETGILNKDNIDLDASSEHLYSFDDNDDDSFDDGFDLNAAINELDQAAEDEANINEPEEKTTATKSKKDIPVENNIGDVFDTDAYDATNASSVEDILNEMEGQLSLDIDEPDNNDNYDANNEFEFIELDEEPDTSTPENNIESNEETNYETLRKHFDFNDVLEEQDELDDDYSESESIHENIVDEDKLFDQVDLSDFPDSDIEENIILDDSHSQNIGQHTPGDENDIPFQLRNDLEHLQTPSQRRIHPFVKFTFIIILFALSFSQLAYFRAHELVNLIPSSQPLLEQFCETVGCHYSGPRDTKQIQLINRDVRLHPKTKKALLISAAMVNNAHFAQPYPDIHIRLSDISGNVVAERIFNAKTYMGKLSNPFLLMKSKTPVHINFEVVDPGKDAINFEFTFL